MNVSMESWSRGIIRVLVIAALLLLGWGAAPVNAAVYEVSTNAAPAATMRYICEDATNLKSGYYAVSSAAELQTLAGIVNGTVAPTAVTVTLDSGDAAASPASADLSINVKLTGDIDLSSVCGSNTNSWSPIGSGYTKSYTGTFDGQGYTVNNLYISAATDNQGLFGYVNNNTIKNLTVAGSITITGTGAQVGGIVGWINSSTIDNCCSQVGLNGSLSTAGGIAGRGAANSVIKNCRNSGAINGTTGTDGSIGGIVGLLVSSTVLDCENSAAITGSKLVGGIAGACNGTCLVTNTSNTAAVKATENRVGGIAAIVSGGVRIANCANTGDLEEGGSDSLSFAGGIVGFAENNNYYNNSTVVNNCYNTGSIKANTDGTAATVYVGTLVGKINSTSHNNSSNGKVDVSSCYWLDSLSLINNNDEIIDKKAVGIILPAGSTTVTVTESSFTDVQGKAIIGSTGSGTLGTTGKYALADALNVGKDSNSSWKVDAGNPVFDSGGYTVVPAPTISGQPTDQSSKPDESYTLSLTAEGTSLGYQWYRLETNSAILGGTAVAAAASTNFTASQSVPGSYYYYCLVTSTVNGVTATARSNTVTVTVIEPEACWVLTTSGTTGSGSLAEAIAACNDNTTGGTITLNKNLTLDSAITISKAISLVSDGSNQITRGSGLAGSDMVTVTDVGNLTLGTTGANTLTLDGGAVWTGTVDPILGRGTINAGLISTAAIVLNSGSFTIHSGVTIRNNAGTGALSTNPGEGTNPAAVWNLSKQADKSAVFTMDGGAIANNYGYIAGAVINGADDEDFNKAILNISGGSIYGNQNAINKEYGAGGIENMGTFNLSGDAVITRNKGVYSGGVDNALYMSMAGGTVTGNDGNYCGGIGQNICNAEYLKILGSTLTISGKPVVSGNTAGGKPSNLGLVNSAAYKTPVIVSEALTDGALIGLSLTTISLSPNVLPTAGNPVTVVVPGEPDTEISSNLSYFSLDNSSYDLAAEDNNLVLKTKISGGGGGYTPPGMSGITVTPRTISFDPNGQLAVDISGLPAGAVVSYSLDGSSYSTTPPTITRVGEQRLYLRISCPGYQDFTTQTTVTVAKQLAPAIPAINAAVSGVQHAGSTDLGALLPNDRGLTRYQLGPVDDPGDLLDGAPTIDQNGLIAYGFRSSATNSVKAAAAGAENTDAAPVQPDAAGLETAAAASKTATIAVLVSMENYQDTTLTLVVSESEPIGVRYLSHIQDIGWESDWVTAGELSGTSGQSKRLEALKVELTGTLPAGASIETAVHVQNQGDLGPFAMGTAAGTSGKSLRLENICLTLNNLPGYSLRYNVHVQNQGWLRDEADSSSWFTSGQAAGTAGLSLRLEGIRIKLEKDE